MKNKNKERSKGISFVTNNIVNSDVWVMDETFFNQKTALLIVIALKTTVILGTCIYKENETEKNAYISSLNIEDLYRQIIEAGNNIPKIVHTDQKTEYRKENILKLFEEYGVKASVAGKNENQVAESINNQIKSIVVKVIFEMYKDNTDFKVFKMTTPDNMKKLSITQKSQSKKYREFIFHSDFFNKIADIYQVTQQAVCRFNAKKSQVSDTSFDRLTLNQLNNIIVPPETLLQGGKKEPLGQLIQTVNDYSYIEAASQIKQIIDQTTLEPETKMQLINDLVITQDTYIPQAQKAIMIALSFIVSQNQNQIKMLNTQGQKMDQLLTENLNLSEQIKILTTENEKQLQIQKIKQLQREKRANRIRRPTTQPFTREMVQDLINEIKGISYNKARIRCAFTILTITGIRYEELRLLKVKQVISLIANSYAPITRKKRGPSNLKAYLRQSGIQFLAERKKDFQILITKKTEAITETSSNQEEIEQKVQESFLFSAEKTPETPISRSFFNNTLNKVLLDFSNKRKMQTVYTTHSFRHDFITELWKDSNDIEYVRQFMGHKRIESTVAYIKNMADAEKAVKLLNIDNAKKQKQEQNRSKC